MLSKKVKARISKNKLHRLHARNKDYRDNYRSFRAMIDNVRSKGSQQVVMRLMSGAPAQQLGISKFLVDDEATARRAARVAEVAKQPRKVIVVG